MAAEIQWSSATHLEIIVTGKRLRVTAVNTTGTPSPTDTSVSKETDLYWTKENGKDVKNVAFIQWSKINFTFLQARRKTGNVCSCLYNRQFCWVSTKKTDIFFSNIFFLPSAGFAPRRKQVHSEASPSQSAEWVLLVDQTDRSHQRAVIIKNKHSGIFLAVQNGLLVGVTSYNEDCKWILE